MKHFWDTVHFYNIYDTRIKSAEQSGIKGGVYLLPPTPYIK